MENTDNTNTQQPSTADLSDYWKSLPRKFCDTCKCWFADNKASIEFHEKGKKHQENVQKRITQIQKKGLKEYKAKQKLENEMEKIEKAALKAFQKDMEKNPDLAEQYKGTVIPLPKQSEENKAQMISSTAKKKNALAKSQRSTKTDQNSTAQNEPAPSQVWYEGTSEDGYKYYWNSVTSESQWEAPEEGFISIEEQNTTSTEISPTEDMNNEDDAVKSKADPEIPSDAIGPIPRPDPIGPMPRPDPYGQWVSVEEETPEVIDLQLPQKPENIVEIHIPVPKEDTFKIKEKTIGYLGDESGEITFKKRKNMSGAKRNIRQRLDDA